MKKFIAIASAFLLLSCDMNTTDSYQFERQTVLLEPRREIIVQLYDSERAIIEAYALKNGRKLNNGEQLQAFSVINNKTCTIHMIDPKYKYDPAFAGHELVHCLYGNFHPKQDESR